jgi:hypothetical protein
MCFFCHIDNRLPKQFQRTQPKMLKQAAFILILAASFVPGKAQYRTSDTTSRAIVSHAGDTYNRFNEKQSRLYNGILHIGYANKIIGYAYWQKDMQQGTIVYDELEFTGVPMLYDLYKDQVVIQHFNHFNMLGLISEKVKEFTLANHHFIRLQTDSLFHSAIITGFYDELYKGQVTVLVKRVKIIEETVKDEVERRFISQDLFFIKKDGTYYAIKNYKTLLQALNDKAKEIKQYLRRNRIKFKKDRENAIAKAAAYYDSLNK